MYCQTAQQEKMKGEQHRADTNRVDRRLLQLAAKEEHDGCAEGGKERNEPDVFEKEHSSRRSSGLQS